MANKKLSWDDTKGGDRDLLREILNGRFDHVEVRSSSLDRLAKLERLGFPMTAGRAFQLWHAGSSTRANCSDSTLIWEANPTGDSANFAEGRRCARLGEKWVTLDETANVIEVLGPELSDEQLKYVAYDALSRNATLLCPFSSEANIVLPTMGFVPRQVFGSCVLHPQLTETRSPSFERSFKLTSKEVEDFGRSTGDLNPLHFDDAYARSLGFQSRISHGMLFNGWLTRLLGQEYPGPGTIFLKSSSVFYSPVYPDIVHSIRISTPILDVEKQFYRIVAQVLNRDNAHCVIAYSDVIRRVIT